MLTVLFVHGTGSREPEYGATLSAIRAGLRRAGARADVRPCYWGGSCGASLRAGGLSIPAVDTDRGSEAFPSSGEIALWGILERDPLFELSLPAAGLAAELAPDAEIPARRLAAAARALPADEALLAALGEADLVAAFCDAVPAVLASEPGRQALAGATEAGATGTGATEAGADLAGALARAFLATALRMADERLGATAPLDGAHREAILTIMYDRLAASHRGAGGALARTGLRLALSLGASRPLERRREAITRSATPFAGDVMRYLVRGEAIRDFIQRAACEAGGPVLLLAHSLGGTAAFDLLVAKPLPPVTALVTVGSQVPYLYELDALPSLPFGERLPAHFPGRWLNVYDRRDLLSYTTAGLLGTGVADVEIDNGAPFPRSHSAYFGNAAFYELLAGWLADLAAAGAGR